jgi:thiamine biosynthesis lipoprotein
MRLDVGGIAKGYALDQALLELQRMGVDRAIVNASGDMAASGPPPGQPGWLVGIAPLQPSAPPSVFGYLAQRAIATSGDAFQYVEIAGVRYSHIVDPHTGLGLTQRSSVSILAPNGTDADGLASAVSVLGLESGLKLVAQLPHTEALIVTQQDGQTVKQQTSGFDDWIVPRPQAPSASNPKTPQ